MGKNNGNGDPKHLKSFWPLFIIVVVSMIAGGIIYSFAFNSKIQDEIDSSTLIPSRQMTNEPVKTPVKKPVAK